VKTHLTMACIAALLLAGCSGGGGGGSTLPGGGGGNNNQGNQTQSENAINGANSTGSTVKTIADAEKNLSPFSSMRNVQSTGNGACNNGVEFFAPDKNGDPNSTETIDFYDSACTEMARDAVRIYSISGSSETVNRTVTLYAFGNSAAIATRTEAVTIINATFGANGFPQVSTGFSRADQGALNISGSKTINSGNEMVLSPQSGSTNNYCADSAGYNATGIASLNETFGWQGGTSNGVRTVNGDGSVTYTATHDGNAYKGPIGSLSLGVGSQNSACPISTPEFTLVGGTQTGSYNIPVSATFKQGVLQNLTVTNATLANGNTLNVVTNSSQPPSSDLFITGTITNGSSPVATFNVDAWGDGTLTTSTGAQFVITDWHVIK